MLQRQLCNQDEQQNQMRELVTRVFATPNTTTVSPKLNPYDGTTSYALFKVQFDLTANRLNWTNAEKTIALAQSLTGRAVEVIDHQDASEGSILSGYDCSHVTASNQSGRVATVSCSQSAASLQTTVSSLQRSCWHVTADCGYPPGLVACGHVSTVAARKKNLQRHLGGLLRV